MVGVVAFAPYARTLGFEFTYDDHTQIVRNPFVRDPGNLRELLPWRYLEHEVPDQGRPALLASLLLDVAVAGPDPAAYHAQSVAWHVLVSLLVYLLAMRTGAGARVAAAAAVLFAVHPIHAEAVAGVSNREDLLATFFVLACLLVGRRALRNGLAWLVPLGLLYGLGLLSKESAVAMPLLLALTVACFPSWRPPTARRGRAVGWTVAVLVLVTAGWATFQLRLGYPSLLPGAGGTGLEVAAEQEGDHEPGPARRRGELRPRAAGLSLHVLQPSMPAAGEDDSQDGEAGARRPHGPMEQVHILSIEGFRLWRLLVPFPLSPEYDARPLRAPWALTAGALVIALLAAAAVVGWRRWRPLAFGVGWLGAATLPVGAPGLLINPVADRYLYLPAVGVCVLVARALLERLPARWPRARTAAWASMAALIGAYAVVGVHQIGIWRNDVVLFEHATAHAPRSVRVHQNLGAARMRAGDLEGARRALGEAVRLDPTHLAARYNLGRIAERRGRLPEAARHYRKALSVPSIVAEGPLRARVRARLRVVEARLERPPP